MATASAVTQPISKQSTFVQDICHNSFFSDVHLGLGLTSLSELFVKIINS